VIGLDLVILACASTLAIVFVGFIAKVFDILRKDLSKQ
jgi:hypothetical protein